MQRGAGAEAPLAEVREIEPELPRHAREQLEVRRREMERAAFDAALRAAEHGVAAGAAKADADLVREDLFRRAHLLERLGVQHLLQLRDEELVGEDGELDEEGARLGGGEIALLEPRGIRVRADHGVAEDLAFEARPKGCCRMPAMNSRLVLFR